MHPARRMDVVALWLAGLYLLILAMVAVGGITRLTESGLSIVDWRPVTGWLPPLSETAWLAEFEKYQTSPQFRQTNREMTLSGFQQIFFWEYLHRVLGRIVGLVALIPWLLLVARGTLRGRWLLGTGALFLLIVVQGVVGWLMVKSGLVDRPAVSHYRLAAHLLLAFGTAQWVLWLYLGWRRHGRVGQPTATTSPAIPTWWTAVLLGTIALMVGQIVLGAFVAGRRAGLFFPTFPDMNGLYLPGPFFTGGLGDILTEPVAMHYAHRALAFLLIIPFGMLIATGKRLPRSIRLAAWSAGALFAVQFVLGAITVLWHVPIAAAVSHQCVAMLLLSALTIVAWQLFQGRRHDSVKVASG